MAISTGEIMILAVLIAVIALAMWWFGVAYNYRTTIQNNSYARGANLDTGAVSPFTGKGTINMVCGDNREICVWSATSICTGAESVISNTESGPEPISGNPVNYGEFDPNTTVDLTSSFIKANGSQTFSINFDGAQLKYGGKTCPLTYNPKDGTGTRPQVIATYACVPPGSTCTSSKPIPPSPPVGEYKFYQYKDSPGGDIGKNLPFPWDIPKLKEACDNVNKGGGNCVAFNAMGYLKSSITDPSKFTSTPNPNPVMGLYVRR